MTSFERRLASLRRDLLEATCHMAEVSSLLAKHYWRRRAHKIVARIRARKEREAASIDLRPAQGMML